MDEGKHVLIVEDEDTIARLLAKIVTSQQYHAQIAGTVSSARRVIAEKELDVIFLDLKLPDGLGSQLLDQIRRENPSAVVTVISAYYHFKEELLNQKNKIDFFLSKPFKKSDVLEVLKTP